MGRILALDYGKKRTGVAVTDPLKIIASGLETLETPKLMSFLKSYVSAEPVDSIVLGMPLGLDGKDTDSTVAVRKFFELLKNTFPEIKIYLHDERFTSKMAVRVMIDAGMKKKDRQEKGNVDKISAVIILQSFLNSLSFQN
jgi:putative holliday junction resolvase